MKFLVFILAVNLFLITLTTGYHLNNDGKKINSIESEPEMVVNDDIRAVGLTEDLDPSDDLPVMSSRGKSLAKPFTLTDGAAGSEIDGDDGVVESRVPGHAPFFTSQPKEESQGKKVVKTQRPKKEILKLSRSMANAVQGKPLAKPFTLAEDAAEGEIDGDIEFGVPNHAPFFTSPPEEEKLTEAHRPSKELLKLTREITKKENKPAEKEVSGVGPAVVFMPGETDDEPLVVESDMKKKAYNDYVDKDQDLIIQISDEQPIFMKPPSDFSPVIYPKQNEVKTPLSFAYPNGLSSWLFGGIRGLEQGGFWQQLGSHLALPKPSTPLTPYRPVRLGSFELLLPPYLNEIPSERSSFSKFSSYVPPLDPYTNANRPRISGLGALLFGGINRNQHPSTQTVDKLRLIPVDSVSSANTGNSDDEEMFSDIFTH